ncbi:MAG: hypothetical protein IJ161_00545 [Bacteroidales bacterium]|nr:hypothetical protein [Bacteroidales bacterium]
MRDKQLIHLGSIQREISIKTALLDLNKKRIIETYVITMDNNPDVPDLADAASYADGIFRRSVFSVGAPVFDNSPLRALSEKFTC